MRIREENLDDYTLKTDEELIGIISEFGCGETEFHTADVERLILEKMALKKEIIHLKKQRTLACCI